MTGQPRAVLFDLDDTLYAERRYALSGYRHLAHTLSVVPGVEPSHAFSVLVKCLKRGARARALQALCQALGHGDDSIPAMVDVMRGHLPVLKLAPSSVRILERLRGAWKVGVVTNGLAGVQRRKVAALGLEPLVDTVVFASEHGTGLGKPDPMPFLVAAERLGVVPVRCVFVGDDPHRDIAGAHAVGMRTIRILRGAYRQPPCPAGCEADAVATTIEDVPQTASALLMEKNFTMEKSFKCA